MLSYEGEKSRLRPRKKEDMNDILKWENDPYLIENTGGSRFPVTEVMKEKQYEEALNDQSRTSVIFAIEDKEDRALAGIIQLNRIDWVSGTSYFAITIGEHEKRGKGIGTDAMHILFRYAFEYLNLRKIYLEVLDFNHSVRKAYGMFGFKKEGTLIEHVYLAHQYYDLHIMSLFKTDYYAAGISG
jgi:RimJ/RimL family protein N-acetyltransferase